MPHHFADTGTGIVLISSGNDPCLRWDGYSSQAESAGVLAPVTAPTMGFYATPGSPIVNTSKYWQSQLVTVTHLYNQIQSVSQAINRMNSWNLTVTRGGTNHTQPLIVGLQGTSKILQGLVPDGWSAKEYIQHLQGQYEEAKDREKLLNLQIEPDRVKGNYYCYLRYVDKYGNYSNLSPISARLAPTSVKISKITFSTPNLVETSAAHNLSTGDMVLLTNTSAADYAARTNQDVFNTVGLPSAYNSINGSKWEVEVVSSTTFNLMSSLEVLDTDEELDTETPLVLTAADFKANLQPVLEVYNYGVTYTSVEVPTDPKIVRRQILRNTDGQTRTFYVDIDTEDLTSTTFTSQNNDRQLAASQAQPIIDAQDNLMAYSRHRPPSHKQVFVAHKDRMFAAVDGVYREGSASVTLGSTTVTGIGTEWKSCFEGRFLYVVGADQRYEIDSVDEAAQTLALVDAYSGATDAFADYTIRPQPADSRLVYWSEVGLPEAWDPFSAFGIPENGDEFTGLMNLTQFLYVLERRNIHRLTYHSDPAVDGFVFHSASRGCVNQRCHVVADGKAFLLDEAGAYMFEGGDVGSINDAVTGIWEDGTDGFHINWQAREMFHAVHHRPTNTILWFVCLSGTWKPRHALCYNYRSQAWWILEFACPITSSCIGEINRRPYVLLGAPFKRCLIWPYGNLDGPDPSAGTVRGTATSATLASITDSGASFPTAGLVGNPIAIVAGRGKGQVRTIASVSSTRINVTQPWLIKPDTTSIYQLGSVAWRWKSGRFWFAEDETQNPRRVGIAFTPTTNACKMDLRIYHDHSTTPEEWKVDRSTTEGGGVASTLDDPDLVCDLTQTLGYLQQRMDNRREPHAPGVRKMAMELRGFTHRDSQRIHEIVVDGVKE